MRLAFLGVLGLVAGCVQTTAPGVTRGVTLNPETLPGCAARCEELGMRLGAIVLIHNSAGCVCEPQGSASHAAGVSGVASGAAVVMDEEATARAAQQKEEEERQRREAEERERQRRDRQ
jgi:hypothetical protein